MLKLDSAVKSTICLFSIFVLLIQEVTHWETNRQQVRTPDCTLESLLVSRQSGTEKITAPRRDGCSFCARRESCESLISFVVVLSGHVFCVMPGVLRI